MKQKPPTLVIAFLASYLLYLASMLVTSFEPVMVGRLALAIVLTVFVLRGSRTAGNILGALCGLSALVLLVSAISSFNARPELAITFALLGGSLGAFAAYMFFSPSVRRFQQTSDGAASS